jgi:NarL family two-component system sensor histidine kinase LiaS
MPQLIDRLKRLFRGLRWKLTLSYTAVTVGALLFAVLALAIPFFSYLLEPNDIHDPEYWIDVLNSGKTVRFVRDLLAESPPNIPAIKLLINNVDATLSSYDVLRIGDTQLSLRTTAQLEGCIVDADGQLLAVTAGELAETASTMRPYRSSAYPELEAPLRAALAGEEDPERLSATRESDGALIVAVPVFDGAGGRTRVLGAIVVVLKSLPVQEDIPSYVTRVVVASLLLFTLAAGIIGTAFGSLTARGLVGRFSRLSNAADGWSQGDFTESVHDPSGDELGQLAQRMNRMAEQLKDLLDKRQEIAVFEERNRLARDLHDSVKQQAFAASAQLGAASALFEQDAETAKTHLSEAERLVDKVRWELTDLIHQLRPVALTDGGLPEALREYASDWAHQSGVEISVWTQGAGMAPPEVEQALFRIAQEALSNVARHSQAHNVEISLVYGSDAVTLTVADDGQGFDVSVSQGGLGLRSMRERTEALGGKLAVQSTLGEGTRISVSCKLSPSQPGEETGHLGD